MPLRTREPGAKDIGYLKYLARRYNFADGLMFAALRELEIYYLLHTPLDHRFVQEMGFNGRRGQRVHARFDGVPETAVCPYDLSFRDYLEFEMVRNTDVYVQLQGLDTAEHTTVFKSDNRRATKRCARDVRLESDEAYVWVRDLLLHGISPYSVSYALTRAGYKVSKDSGVITRAVHEIHSSLMTPGGKGELQRIMAETPMLGQSSRSLWYAPKNASSPHRPASEVTTAKPTASSTSPATTGNTTTTPTNASPTSPSSSTSSKSATSSTCMRRTPTTEQS